MVSYEDILIRIRGEDNTGGAFGSVESRVHNTLPPPITAIFQLIKRSFVYYFKLTFSIFMLFL